MKTKFIKIMSLLVLFILIDFSGCTNIADYENNKNILSIQPSPINNVVYIEYHFENDMFISLTIADNFGREIIKIVDDQLKPKGVYEHSIDLSKQPSGVYSCILNLNGKVYIKEFSLIR